MKDIKSYVIGFLTCACLFLIMGQTKSDSQIGRYQNMDNGLLDTATGDFYARNHNDFNEGEWRVYSKMAN